MNQFELGGWVLIVMIIGSVIFALIRMNSYTKIPATPKDNRSLDMKDVEPNIVYCPSPRRNPSVTSPFSDATEAEYISWLLAYIKSGGGITHFYDYDFPRGNFLVAQGDFTLGGECGASARSIIVPHGLKHLSGGRGHNNLYFWDGMRVSGLWVPAYQSMIGLGVPEIIEAAEVSAKEHQKWRADIAASEAERLALAGQSDLSKYTSRSAAIKEAQK